MADIYENFDALISVLDKNQADEVRGWFKEYRYNKEIAILKKNKVIGSLIKMLTDQVQTIDKQLTDEEFMEEKKRFTLFQFKKACKLVLTFFDDAEGKMESTEKLIQENIEYINSNQL